MKKILLGIAAALLLTGVAGTAQADEWTNMTAGITASASAAIAAAVGEAPDPPEDPRNLPFFEAGHTPAQLADMITAEYWTRSPNGEAPISPALCKAKRSCASAANLFRAFKEVDPTATNLNRVQDIGNYLRSLRRVDPPNGQYQMFCLHKMSNGGYREVTSCLTRRFKAGEYGYVSLTGIMVMADNCKNPINGPLVSEVVATASDCVEVRIPVDDNDVGVRIGINGNRPLPQKSVARCLGIKRPGQTTLSKGLPDECRWGTWTEADGTKVECNLDRITVAAGKPVQNRGGIVVKGQPGYWILSLPAEVAYKDLGYVVSFCLEEEVDGKRRDSNSFMLTDDDYQYPPEGESGGKRVTLPAWDFGSAYGTRVNASR